MVLKLILCKLCQDLVVMNKKIGQCDCGNAVGRYLDDNFSLQVDVTKGNWTTLRIVGIDNRLLINETLPDYVRNRNPESNLLFEAWGSAIIIVPPWMLSEVSRINKDRFPEVEFKGE